MMNDATFTSDTATAAMNRHRLLEQLAIIRSLFCKESSADDAAAAARNRNVVEGRAKEGVRLINDQMAAVSMELLLTVMSDMMLLRLLDGLGLEEGRAVPSSDAAPDQHSMLMDVDVDVAAAASATKKMKRAAAKKKRNKRNKAAAKHKKNKKTKLMSWMGSGRISLFMMIAFGSIATLIFPLSLIHQSDGSGEGEAPPALPPSASKSLRQKDHRSNYDESVSSDIDIISPLPAVPPSIFSPTFVSNRHMKSDGMRASTSCVDTPNWLDKGCAGCYWYGITEDPGCPGTDDNAGDMGPASEHCCFCEGGSHTCEDFRSKCQKYINVEGFGFEDGVVAPLCQKAESCSCEGEDHDVEIVHDNVSRSNLTVGLYNECKCDFWSRLCEDTTGVGEACDVAAEYCCGEYRFFWSYNDDDDDDEGVFVKEDDEKYLVFEQIWYLNSPTCYCDFFNYAQSEFKHTLTQKAMNVGNEFTNPCNIIEEDWLVRYDSKHEMASLKAIYKGTNGQNWKNNAGWMSETEHHCEWYGISCDEDAGRYGFRYVTSIDLRDNNLAGQFPVYTRSTTDFSESQWLYSKYDLANLYNLKTLNLADNKLTGTIEYRPLYNLASLTRFDVSGNQLSGEVDALITPSVTHADFSNNSFTSIYRFKKYKGSFQSLSFCDVSKNAIQSNATAIFNNIPPNIAEFFASNNQFYGSLPESFNNLRTLGQFNMSYNALSGSLPESLKNLPALRQFDMSSNALSGKLPDFAESISILQELDLSNQANTNGFTGPIPEDIWRFESLKILNLAGNKLTGTIPLTIGDMTVLQVLELSSNSLKGSIPSELGNRIGTLKRLGLANNILTGTIPSQLGQLREANILLKDNLFDNKAAPLSLCLKREVKEFDLAYDPTFCPIERNALVEFYDAAKGAKWTDGLLWLDEDASHCGWKGVSCNVDGRVTKLNLANNGLSGRLSKRIGNIHFIEELDLSDNDIEGSFPAEIDSLSYLTYLRLSSNAFTGSIPEDIDLLSKLTYLGLNENAFNGSIPEDIWTSQSLKIMNLAGNKLSGTIPPTIGNMTVLEVLELSSNSLSGQIPFQIGQLEGTLKRLDLASNGLSGTIPSQLGQLQGASVLLKDNLFDNKIAPLGLCMLHGVEAFDLANDMKFCPIEQYALVDFYDSTSGAEWTDRTNWLDGDEYASYCDWKGVTCEENRVTKLNLSNNGLSGRLSESIGNLTFIEELDLSDNDIKGSIPAQIGLLPNLTYLRLGNNDFIGTAPRSLCMLHSVEEFDLAQDMAFCPIERNALIEFYDSTKGANWTDRTNWLDGDEDEYASYCNWKGVTCDDMNRVTELKLTNNGLSGGLSESIGDLAFIEVLDLSDNDIKGSIPAEIGLLSKLTHLLLSSNSFNGPIPEDLGRFLKIMNLADNELTGSIPEDLGRFQSLKILNLAGNKLSRKIPPTIGDMTVLEVLELSSNSLSGQIPFQIGQLEGTLNRLDLSNNTLFGTIPSQIGLLQGASILLKDNLFEDKTSPLGLCMLHGVEAFDLANDTTFCPIERNALSDFYDSAKGAEWTDRTNWLDGDEYASYCEWDGVTCDDMNRVTQLNLSNNGLSGRLSKSIGNLKFIEVLDLSDNDIKGSIPTEIGNLKNLTYLRLSYNAFTGAAPEGLGELALLQLLQLQTNRITKIPNIPQLDESKYNRSTFVTDCGVPSAFDKALACTHCTMCCNANEDCYPQEDTQVAEWGFDYITFAAVLFAGFIAFCCIVALSIYLFSKRKNRGNALTKSTERSLEEDDKYALSRIGKSSVYSYFVTDKVLGWLVAFATLGIQIGILVFFVMASEANLQNDAIDIQFTWKCPRDSDECKNKADLNKYGWGIFSMLMVANLAKDMISGSKLIYHSSKVRHPLGSRIRYFVGGTLLCSITLFALYVSTVYNMAIATSNTDIIVNSVIVLFVMDLDEWIFAALEACKEKWTAHAADSEDSSSEAEKGGAIDEMKDRIALQDAQIADQQKELMRQKIQIEQMARQFGGLTELQDGVQNMQQSQAGSCASFETIVYCDPNANESATSKADAVEPEDAQLDADADAREGGTMNGTKMRNHYRKIKLGIRRGRPSTPNASGSGYNRL